MSKKNNAKLLKTLKEVFSVYPRLINYIQYDTTLMEAQNEEGQYNERVPT